MTEHTTQRNTLKVIGIIGAWMLLPIIGITLAVLTSISAAAVIEAYDDDADIARFFVVSGLLGLVGLAIIILSVWKFRKVAFVFHLLIGFWIGVGIYALMFLGGSGSLVYHSTTSLSSEGRACTSPEEQYLRNAAAIIPIGTDIGASGTGFAIKADGTIMTAYHVIEGAGEVYADYATGKVGITVVETAPEYDLALLRLADSTPTYFNLTDQYAVTDEVYAFGYPGNSLDAGPPSLSEGIVSRILTTADLRMTDSTYPDGFEVVQTDAAINAGNSGGPLIGSCGVIGVVNSISDASQLSEYIPAVSEQGIGYAVSSKSAMQRFDLYVE